MKTLFDREPPHNAEAERSVLGSMLINPHAVGQAVEILGEGNAEAFYVPAHQHVYSAAVSLFRRSTPADTDLEGGGYNEDEDDVPFN